MAEILPYRLLDSGNCRIYGHVFMSGADGTGGSGKTVISYAG